MEFLVFIFNENIIEFIVIGFPNADIGQFVQQDDQLRQVWHYRHTKYLGVLFYNTNWFVCNMWYDFMHKWGLFKLNFNKFCPDFSIKCNKLFPPVNLVNICIVDTGFKEHCFV